MLFQRISALLAIFVMFVSQTGLYELSHFAESSTLSHTYCVEHGQIEHVQSGSSHENKTDSDSDFDNNASFTKQLSSDQSHTSCLILCSRSLTVQKICYCDELINVFSFAAYSSFDLKSHQVISLIYLSPSLSPPGYILVV